MGEAMTKNVEIFRVGEETVDGRIVHDVTWREGILPVFAWPVDDAYAGDVIGHMFNIRRDGNRIYCDTDVDVEAITVDCDQMVFNLDDEDYVLSATSARIIAGHLNTRSNYPWKDWED